jgi:Tol biopolymer transport system component
MALSPGARIGPYEVSAQIGVGGMGEVYRAIDTNLARPVAIKVLPAAVAGDADRLARFDREARTLAALNHPNIAQIHGLERSADTTAIVMELVEGPTLADRIREGPIPVDEAMAMARQIVEALQAAHERGVVHRDLKPANVKVRPDGAVKVLDFGLAKAMEPAADLTASSGQAASMSPTITTPAMTQAGIVLGTAAYMSPEQARGRPADRRADIWSFGCVLWEMLTGERLFRGEDTSEVLASVIKDTPDWSRVPQRFRRLLMKCLERDPQRRLRDISGALLLLEDQPDADVTSTGGFVSRRLPWVAAGVMAVVAVLALAAVWRMAGPSPPLETARFRVPFPGSTVELGFALSPDGRYLVMTGAGAERRLWLRPVASFDGSPLTGTEGAVYPFWKPDGRAIAFFAGSQLKALELTNGSVQVLAQVGTSIVGGSWADDGTIVFSDGGALYSVAETGGDAVRLEHQPQGFNVLPQFLPGQPRFLFLALAGQTGVYVASSLDDAPEVPVLPASQHVVYAPSPDSNVGHLLTRQGTTLMAQEFDADRLELLGEPVRLADRLGSSTLSLIVPVSSSATGVLAYATGFLGLTQLTWVDRTDTAQEVVGAPYTYSDFRLSPDQSRVVMTATIRDSLPDIYARDLSGSAPVRLTFDGGVDNLPIFAPDGERVLFPSNRNEGAFDLYVKTVSGDGTEQMLVQMGTPTGWGTDWSRDGRYILYQRPGADTGQDLWIAPQGTGEEPFPYLNAPLDEMDGAFSPDARWIAYVSTENGPPDVFVESFPRSGTKFQVSDDGGAAPTWRQDGRELFYLDRDQRLVAVPVTTTETTVRFGTRLVLFPTGIAGRDRREYDVSPDGQRFLLALPAPVDAEDEALSVVVNWQADLER